MPGLNRQAVSGVASLAAIAALMFAPSAGFARGHGSGGGGGSAGSGGPPGRYSFPTGTFRGSTSQGKPFSFRVSKARLKSGFMVWKVTNISFGWIQNCQNPDGSTYRKDGTTSGLPTGGFLPIAFPGFRYGNDFRGSTIPWQKEIVHLAGRIRHSKASGIVEMFTPSRPPAQTLGCSTNGTPGLTSSGITWTAHHV